MHLQHVEHAESAGALLEQLQHAQAKGQVDI